MEKLKGNGSQKCSVTYPPPQKKKRKKKEIMIMRGLSQKMKGRGDPTFFFTYSILCSLSNTEAFIRE